MRVSCLACLTLACLACGVAPPQNDCGGEKLLPATPGDACATGIWTCDGPDALRCADCASGMCRVEAAELTMGCDTDECRTFVRDPGGTRLVHRFVALWETPRHAVSVPAFEIDRLEVTVREYRACASCTAPSNFDPRCNWGVAGRDEHPVNCVSWNQARAYCGSVGKRLCSEAEWERAARGTDGRTFPWGDAPVSCDVAVFDDAPYDQDAERDGCGTGTTAAVGGRAAGASPVGALDMAGNVAEWVEDDWHHDYQGARADGQPWCTGTASCADGASPRAYSRVVRGGSFVYFPFWLRTTTRDWGYPDTLRLDAYYVGIRCCR